jgi:hypothetical protein
MSRVVVDIDATLATAGICHPQALGQTLASDTKARLTLVVALAAVIDIRRDRHTRITTQQLPTWTLTIALHATQSSVTCEITRTAILAIGGQINALITTASQGRRTHTLPIQTCALARAIGVFFAFCGRSTRKCHPKARQHNGKSKHLHPSSPKSMGETGHYLPQEKQV